MQTTTYMDDDVTGPRRKGRGAPAKIGRFVVLREIGAGGMGVVCAAYDPELDRKVAVKLLHPSLSGSDREDVARARLQREAQALARLSHPNVVAVYDVGTHEDQVFIAMEFVAGASLTEWLRARPRTVDEVLAVFQGAGRGLAAAHREGLVHGDFKPDNVLVDQAGRVRVVDFGLAFAQEPGHGEADTTSSRGAVDLSSPLMRTGGIVGTPAYLSPEQFVGEPGSAQSDQFAFCVALYEALYGARPFAGDSLPALKLAICQAIVPDEPRDRRLPAWLRRLLLRGLQLDPAQRFPSMDALLAALSRDPGRARRRGLLAALAVVALVAAAYAYRWTLVRAYEERQGLCAAAADNLVGVWDAARRGEVEAAILATKVPYAADTWRRVAANLDAYTEAWVRMHTEACQATHLRGEQSAALLDLRMACLQRRSTAVHSLVEVLADADAGVVERAAEAVADLPELAPCADAAGLLDAGAAPVRPGQAAAREQIERLLAQARAHESTARFSAGLALADDATARAQGLGDPVVLAEARLVRGALQTALGEPQAIAALTEAFFTAESTRDDVLLARVALELMYAATQRVDVAAAELWSRHARALLDRIGDARPRERDDLEVGYRGHLGTLHVHNGAYAQADADYRRALELRQRIGGSALRLAGVHNNLGNLLLRVGRLEDGQASLERAAAIYREELGASHPSLAVAFNNLGEVFMRRGDWAGAREQYRQARRIFAAALGPEHVHVGVADNNLGDVALRLGELAAAAPLYEHALAIFTRSFGEAGPPLAYPLTGLGELRLAQGRAEEARALLERALALPDAGSPTDLGRRQIALARALASDPAAAERAAALAEEARAAFSAAGPAFARELAATEAWIRGR